jgi:hypothetical protein
MALRKKYFLPKNNLTFYNAGVVAVVVNSKVVGWAPEVNVMVKFFLRCSAKKNGVLLKNQVTHQFV